MYHHINWSAYWRYEYIIYGVVTLVCFLFDAFLSFLVDWTITVGQHLFIFIGFFCGWYCLHCNWCKKKESGACGTSKESGAVHLTGVLVYTRGYFIPCVFTRTHSFPLCIHQDTLVFCGIVCLCHLTLFSLQWTLEQIWTHFQNTTL